MSKVCAQCDNYTGGGDWGLCCKKTYDLKYEDTRADGCPNFEQTDKCINASSIVGMFRCSQCGFFCQESKVDDVCPVCEVEITGARWGGQKHWRSA